MGDEVVAVAMLAPPPPPPLPVDEAMVDATAVSVSGDVIIEGHENGNVLVGVVEAVEEEGRDQAPVDENALTSEEERLWSAVKENAADFNSWTVLIQETEKLENLARIEKVYDAFLAEFPLCYGYWKKYADHEAKLGSPEKIVEVYERAVKAVTYSVDIWMHYCTYAMEKFDSPEKIRSFSSCTSFAVSAKRWSHVGGALSFHFIG